MQYHRETYPYIRTNKKVIAFVALLLAVLFILHPILLAEVNDQAILQSVDSTEREQADEVHEAYLPDPQQARYLGEPLTFKINDEVLGSGDEVQLTIEVPETGLYRLLLEYRVPQDNPLDPVLALQINGAYPHDLAKKIRINSQWMRNPEPSFDRYGHEIVSEPMLIAPSQTMMLRDSEGFFLEGLLFPFEAGESVLTLQCLENKIELLALTLMPQSQLEMQSLQAANLDGDDEYIIEGENYLQTNSSSTRAGAEYDPLLSPLNQGQRRLNILDGASFKKGGQFVTYKIQVEKTADYALDILYRQLAREDYPAFVNIYLQEMAASAEVTDADVSNDAGDSDLQAWNTAKPTEVIAFNYPLNYASSFTVERLKTQANDPLTISLQEDTIYLLKIEISQAPLTAFYGLARELVDEIQSLTLQVNRLAGGNRSEYRDFDVLSYIPDAQEQLLSFAERTKQLKALAQDVSHLEHESGLLAGLDIAYEAFNHLAEHPNDLPKRMPYFSEGSSSALQYIASLMTELQTSDLSIDRIILSTKAEPFAVKTNVFQTIAYQWRRFVDSFGEQDYEQKAASKTQDALQVWVARPRQYLELMQQLTDAEYNGELRVDLSLMPDPHKLVLANAVGESPDIATGINYTLPFELGIRGALKDFTEFEGDKVYDLFSRVSPGLLVPSVIDGGLYSIPETMNFWILYYRKDILEDLKLDVPQTMDDMVNLQRKLKRYGKDFYYPTAGMLGMKIFAGTMPPIYQHDGTFYGETLGKSQLDSEASLQGMKSLTDLFRLYDMPYEVVSFFQNFRDGTIPIGMADYSMYNLLTNAAPELDGLWDIALFPGLEQDDGTIIRWTTGGAESAVIFADSELQEEAFDYLDWWLSEEVQADFGNKLQMNYGQEYLWNTANLKAFRNLPWPSDQREIIVDQANWYVEVPRVLGTYMVERETSNAYNAIVLQHEELRDAVDEAVKRIDRETLRKMEEFSFAEDGEIVKPYEIPSLEDVLDILGSLSS